MSGLVNILVNMYKQAWFSTLKGLTTDSFGPSILWRNGTLPPWQRLCLHRLIPKAHGYFLIRDAIKKVSPSSSNADSWGSFQPINNLSLNGIISIPCSEQLCVPLRVKSFFLHTFFFHKLFFFNCLHHTNGFTSTKKLYEKLKMSFTCSITQVLSVCML